MKSKKYTCQQVKERIENDGHILISTEYLNGKTPIQIQCGKCNTIYNVRFQAYLAGTKCKKCSDADRGIKRRVSEDDVKKLMEERGDLFKRLYFIKNRARVEFQCGECSMTFNLVYFNYQRRNNCSCERTKTKLDINYIKEYVLSQGEELISANYVNAKAPLEIECCNCNGIYDTDWNSYKRGVRCGLCSKYKKKTIEDVQELVKNGGDVLISTEYKNCVSDIEIQCGNCNENFQCTYARYRQGDRCPPCSLKRRIENAKHSQEYVENYIFEHEDKLISKYNKMDDKLEIKCGKCNEMFSTSFQCYKTYMVRCPCQSISKGERIIKEYLEKNNIPFEKQKTFPGCKKLIALRFDYYLPTYDVLIEFDGSLHFCACDLFGGNKTLQNTRKSDIIKNIYCIKNNKKLLRISYNYIRSVERILENYLNNPNKNIIEYSSIGTYAELILETNDKLKINTIINQQIFN